MITNPDNKQLETPSDEQSVGADPIPKTAEHKAKVSVSLTEFLLCLAILSLALYPTAFLIEPVIVLKRPSREDFIATMLAHHASECLAAKRMLDQNYIPEVALLSPVVYRDNYVLRPHKFFSELSEKGCVITKDNESDLFKAFSPFSFSVDTYLLDTRFFKVLCTVSYGKGEDRKDISFERVLYSDFASADQIPESDNYEYLDDENMKGDSSPQ